MSKGVCGICGVESELVETGECPACFEGTVGRFGVLPYSEYKYQEFPRTMFHDIQQPQVANNKKEFDEYIKNGWITSGQRVDALNKTMVELHRSVVLNDTKLRHYKELVEKIKMLVETYSRGRRIRLIEIGREIEKTNTIINGLDTK